jgi:2,3-bisphosphoglycerate-independent phosphoglycerate mutase
MERRGLNGPVVLVILDGWGINPDCADNAVCLARTPRLDALFRNYPHTRIGASGLDVGLPEGQMGNSEVGHLNIGAGRIVYQDLTRISKSIADGDFFTNPAFDTALDRLRQSKGKLHLLGLLSDGGVHSHITHLYALVELARRRGIADVCIHAFLDGRDTPPQSGADYLGQLEVRLKEIGTGRLATIMGRYYAMDRDNRWERVERAWRAMVLGEGESAVSAAVAIEASYQAGQTDEFVLPRMIVPPGERPATIADGDAVIFFNFRSDRAREITRALTDSAFSGFPRPKTPNLVSFVCLSEYDETFDLPVAFPSDSLSRLLGEVVAKAGLRQLRIAETEKYAHVTFFFNGGSEVPFPGEDRVLVPSPKDVATYDQKPAMSAPAVTDEVVRHLAAGRYDLVILNFANPDMVGHTGILPAAISAMETIDGCVGRVVDAALAAGGGLLITADHGNCEQMVSMQGQPHTAHTSNPVPLLLVTAEFQNARLRDHGILADLAPTILALMGLAKPSEMTGENLLL